MPSGQTRLEHTVEDIFISHGSPDQDLVLPVIRRLRQFGFDIREYQSGMPPGIEISSWILESIQASRLAILLVSAKSLNREWLATEIDWCWGRFKAGQLHIVPVLVGSLSREQTHHLLRNSELRFYTLGSGQDYELELTQLVDGVRTILGQAAPNVVPAALLAMNSEQYRDLVKVDAHHKLLSPLCEKLGMGSFPPLGELLRTRYGESAEDFSPFPGTRLVEIIHRTLESSNRARRLAKRSPIWLRWCTTELFEDDSVRDLWMSGPSLLVVDSISVLCKAVADRFLALPAAIHPASSALLWVPPYTTHTAGLEVIMEQSLQTLKPLLDKFRRWERESTEPFLAFDIGTPATLRRWLYRAFGELTVEAQPLAGNLAEMRTSFPSMMRPEAFFTMRPAPGAPA
jgi:hypothetical protein